MFRGWAVGSWGKQSASLFCLPGNGNVRSDGVPSCTNPGTDHRMHHLLREKGNSVVPVVGFAENVLWNPTPRVKGGYLWEAIRQEVSMTLFPCLECCHTHLLCSCPGLCVQLQLVLPIPAGLPTELFAHPSWGESQPQPYSSPLQAGSHSEIHSPSPLLQDYVHNYRSPFPFSHPLFDPTCPP